MDNGRGGTISPTPPLRDERTENEKNDEARKKLTRFHVLKGSTDALWSMDIDNEDRVDEMSDDMLTKHYVSAIDPELGIKGLQFEIASEDDVAKISHLEITSADLYDHTNPKRPNAEYGILDKRLGTMKKREECPTCGLEMQDCCGHFGNVTLPLPVYHIGFFKTTLRIFQSVCKTCARVLLSPQQHRFFLHAMRETKTRGKLGARELVKAITTECRKRRQCFWCGAINGKVVKASKWYGIVHAKFDLKEATMEKQMRLEEFELAASFQPELAKNLNHVADNPTPLTVYNLFKKVTNEDAFLLNIPVSRPEDLLITNMLVPPVCVRPSVEMGHVGTNEDDLTVKVRDILVLSNLIRDAVDSGKRDHMYYDYWTSLQTEVARYINSDLPGFPASANSATRSKALRSICQRLKGKTGRFRGNLQGKRVDFSARTVISPDPNVSVDQVVIPMQVAMTLSYPERVNKHNIEDLRMRVRNGPLNYPGANFLKTKKDTNEQYLKYGDREQRARSLRFGDTVHRHLRDGDVVLFNRQPSLHRMSIMCHRVVVKKFRTFRFNVTVCNPYNADFDGDEMNMHVPQTEESRAEAAELMIVHRNFITPKHGEPLVVPIQDFLTAMYLLTNKNVFYDKGQFTQICSSISHAEEHIDLPPPAIIKPMSLWTGKQIVSVLLRPNSDPKWPLLTLELKTKLYPKKAEKPDAARGCMDHLDRYIVFRKGQHLCGNLDKKALGSSKTGVFLRLIRSHGDMAAARVMNRIAKLCSRWLGHRGFSIGIDDVTPTTELALRKDKIMDDGYAKCDTYLEEYESGEMESQPGCTQLETLESKMLGELSKIREVAGSLCIKTLEYFHNAPIIMATSGSKGSTINIAQMIACVGQQAVQGSRIQNGFVGRSLPHFPLHARKPASRGFVRDSFYSGLDATEFLFHSMAGREGLVDTAVKTAETGYLQRRLMKALEDVAVHYDNTVRNCEDVVTQFSYGEDGLDPIQMEDAGPVDLAEVLTRVLTHTTLKTPPLLPDEIFSIGVKIIRSSRYSREFVTRRRRKVELGEDVTETVPFLSDIKFFLSEFKTKALRTRKKLDLPSDKLVADNQDESIYVQIAGIDLNQLTEFLRIARETYILAVIEPGSAVGAVGGQSIGEPGTQMTLKTFHFAGVASMNITLGVPRIKEIVNASESINTPIISTSLACCNNEASARIVKGKVEATTLGEVCKHIRLFMCNDHAFVEIVLDRELISVLQLEIDSRSVKRDIILQRKQHLDNIKVAGDLIVTKGRNKLRVYSPDNSREKLMFTLSRLQQQLPAVQVQGIQNIARAVISKPDPIVYRWEYSEIAETSDMKDDDSDEGDSDEKDADSRPRTRQLPALVNKDIEKMYRKNPEAKFEIKYGRNEVMKVDLCAKTAKDVLKNKEMRLHRIKKEYELTVEGDDFRSVLNSPGVDAFNTTSNNTITVEKVLGIEAARETIIRELRFVFSSHGLTVDERHIMLLADTMTFKGKVLGINRHGIAKMKDSALMQASFETPVDHLFAAATEGELDPIRGVSECIIVGKPMPIGTGLFKLMRQVDPFNPVAQAKPILGFEK